MGHRIFASRHPVPIAVRGGDLTCLAPSLSQVVYNASDATVFLPRLLPALEKATQTIPDPEARAVVEEAHGAMIKLGADGAANAPTHLLEHDVRQYILTTPHPAPVAGAVEHVL